MDPLGTVRSQIVDRDLPRRLARAYVRWQLRRAWWIALFCVAGGLVLVSLALWAVTGRATIALLSLAWIAVVAVIPLLSYRMTLRSARAAYPTGSTIEGSVTDEVLHVTSAMGTSEIRFAALRSVHESGDALILRLTTSAGAAALVPRDLFTADDIALLRAAAAR